MIDWERCDVMCIVGYNVGWKHTQVFLKVLNLNALSKPLPCFVSNHFPPLGLNRGARSCARLSASSLAEN